MKKKEGVFIKLVLGFSVLSLYLAKLNAFVLI